MEDTGDNARGNGPKRNETRGLALMDNDDDVTSRGGGLAHNIMDEGSRGRGTKGKATRGEGSRRFSGDVTSRGEGLAHNLEGHFISDVEGNVQRSEVSHVFSIEDNDNKTKRNQKRNVSSKQSRRLRKRRHYSTSSDSTEGSLSPTRKRSSKRDSNIQVNG